MILRLILGPSGDVGTFAVQLARAFCAKAAGLRRRQDGPGRVHRRRPHHRLSPSGHCRGGWVLRPGPRHRRQSPGFRFAARSGYGQIGSAGATAITMPRIGGSGRARGAAHSPPDQRILGRDMRGITSLASGQSGNSELSRGVVISAPEVWVLGVSCGSARPIWASCEPHRNPTTPRHSCRSPLDIRRRWSAPSGTASRFPAFAGG